MKNAKFRLLPILPKVKNLFFFIYVYLLPGAVVVRLSMMILYIIPRSRLLVSNSDAFPNCLDVKTSLSMIQRRHMQHRCAWANFQHPEYQETVGGNTFLIKSSKADICSSAYKMISHMLFAKSEFFLMTNRIVICLATRSSSGH